MKVLFESKNHSWIERLTVIPAKGDKIVVWVDEEWREFYVHKTTWRFWPGAPDMTEVKIEIHHKKSK